MNPYLSIVAASRNDDHGGNLLHRMQIFIETLLSGCDMYDIDAELVLVEWNPPDDRPRLVESLRWPSSKRCAVRILEVSKHQHDRFGSALPLHQMIAKNVGIRRAKGQFVVATNIDVLFSEELFRHIARRTLDPNRFYRADRHDVPADISAGQPLAEQMGFCRTNVLRVHRCDGTYDMRTGRFDRIFRPTWQLVLAAAALPLMVTPSARARAVNARKSLAFIRAFGRLHTNASGDFTMMSRERWHELSGYWEFPGFPAYIDGLLCHAAHFAGVEEEILPSSARVYHIEHGHGSGYGEYKRSEFWEGMHAVGIPRITQEQYEGTLSELKAGRGPAGLSREQWGLAGEDLKSRSPSPAAEVRA